jgi:hypothetical protein
MRNRRAARLRTQIRKLEMDIISHEVAVGVLHSTLADLKRKLAQLDDRDDDGQDDGGADRPTIIEPK